MHRDRNRLKAGLLLAGAVGFAALGQYYFHNRREYYWDGIIFISLALICFAWSIGLAARSVRQPRKSPALTWRGWVRRTSSDRRSVPIMLALLLNLVAARSANTHPPPNSYTFSVALWIASLIIFYIAFAPFSYLPRNTWQAIRRARYSIRHDRRYVAELVLVLGLILIGMLLRVWDLAHIPANVSGDEGTQGVWAVDVLEGRLRNPFATGWLTVPTMTFYALAGSLRLFGDSVAGLRTLSALTGSATLVFTYLLARRGFGQRVALFALAALTFSHFHIHFSRLAMNNVADAFFIVLTLWLLTEGLQRASNDRNEPDWNTQSGTRNTRCWFLAAGLTLGLCWYGYFGSRVITLVVVSFLGIQAIMERGFLRRHAPALTLMALMAVMVLSPLLLHYADFPENLTARFNQVSFFRWLENELARPDHDSLFSLVIRQVWRSISAFNYTLDPTFWYHAQIPLLDFISGILFILGLVVAVSQWRKPTMRLILLWFGIAVTFGWVLTENPPSSMRTVVVAPALAILVGLGLDRLLTLARWSIGGRREQWNWIGLVVLVFAALFNVYYYFFDYTPTRVYGNPTAETATVLARYLHSHAKAELYSAELTEGQDTQPFVYFYGPPFLYYDFGTIKYLARNVPGVDVPPADQDPGFRTQVTGPTLFVVVGERMGELKAVQARHADGQLYEFFSQADGRLMFVVYEVLR